MCKAMWKSRGGPAIGLAAIAAISLLAAVVAPAAAADLIFPAGWACAGFDLGVDIGGGGPQNYREFTDANGNVVRWISAGRGNALTFTNMTTETTLSLRANGSVTRVVNRPGGTSTWTTTGHNVLILFPTDVPAGPSTTLHVGQVVFTVDAAGVFTVLKTTGTATNICATLSP